MSKYDALLSPVQTQFKQVAQSLCVRQQNVKQSDTMSHKKEKSSAQVESSGRQSLVCHNSGALKREGKRNHRVTTRFSEQEKARLVAKAKEARLNMNGYIRASVLGAGYISAIDPTKRQHLIDLQRELNKQGNNLNQIAKHLNAGILNPLQGKDTLSVLARSLVDTHFSVRLALSEGKTEE